MKQTHSWSKPPDQPDLIGRKKVDPSFIIHGDTTIPREFHEEFDQANGGHHLEKGESQTVTLEHEGTEYEATIRNADRGVDYSDTYKLQFKPSKIFPLLQRKLKHSKTRLEELREQARQEDRKPYASLPDEEAEYVHFYETDQPFRYRVELTTRQDQNDASPPQQQPEGFVDRLDYATRRQALHYPRELILALQAGLICQPFTLLAGPTGTGKTRLAMALDELDDISVEVIEAEGGWLDSSSAFGYISPATQDFVPGPILLRLLDLLGPDLEDDITPVLLIDEINVSPPHVYLAPLLSALERAAGRDEPVPLLIAQSGISDESRQALKKAEDLHPNLHLQETGPFLQLNLDIPSTLRVVGTLNFDASTEDLAPKLLSRSFVVWFEPPNIDDNLNMDAQTSYDATPHPHPQNILARTLHDLSTRGYPISARTVRRAENALQTIPSDNQKLIDILLSGLVLPHLQTIMEGQDEQKFEQTFLDDLPNGLFQTRLHDMRHQLRAEGMANLWLVSQ